MSILHKVRYLWYIHYMILDWEEQKRRKGRVNLMIDDEFWTGAPESILTDCVLKQGMTLNEADRERIEEAIAAASVWQAAGRLLSVRARSQAEMERRLAEYGYGESVVRRIILELDELGYIDDDDFAQQLIQGQRSKGRSRMRTSWEVRKAGVEAVDDLMEEHYPPEDEYSVALNWARSRWRNDNERVSKALQSRGFSWDVIQETLNSLQEESDLTT